MINPRQLRGSSKSFQQDYQHENGNYVCKCFVCKEPFMGYKRRVICKECSRVALTESGFDTPPALPVPSA